MRQDARSAFESVLRTLIRFLKRDQNLSTHVDRDWLSFGTLTVYSLVIYTIRKKHNIEYVES